MKYYINTLVESKNFNPDFKKLIPNMNLRRRMSDILKVSVATAMEALQNFEKFGNVESILTGTSLGCISDSELFLKNYIISDEKSVNPKAFIQSTFNTVGAQVALLKGFTCYNNTFVSGNNTFETMLVDAFARLNLPDNYASLVGVFDEITPTVSLVMDKLNLKNSRKLGASASFFILTKERLECSVAEISELEFLSKLPELENAKILSENCDDFWIGSGLELISQASRGEEFVLINDKCPSIISKLKVRCL